MAKKSINTPTESVAAMFDANANAKQIAGEMRRRVIVKE